MCSCFVLLGEEILKKIGVFQVFFLILGANPCFWVKNGGRYVNLQGMGNVGNKKTSIN